MAFPHYQMNGGDQPPSAAARHKNGTLARRDADGRRDGKQSEDKAVAPSAQRRQSKRMRVRRPHDKKRGKSACGSDQKRRTLRSAQRGTECVSQTSRSADPAPDRHPNGPGHQARSASADRAGRPEGSPIIKQYPRRVDSPPRSFSEASLSL